MTKNEDKVLKLVNKRLDKKTRIESKLWYGTEYIISDDFTVTGFGGAFGSNFHASYKGVDLPEVSSEFLRDVIQIIEDFNIKLYESSNEKVVSEFQNLKV